MEDLAIVGLVVALAVVELYEDPQQEDGEVCGEGRVENGKDGKMADSNWD